MGDQDGAFHRFFEGGDGAHGNGDALEVGEAGVVDVKGEEGGNGRREFMLCVANGLACFGTPQASGGDEDVFAFQGASVSEMNAVAVRGECFEGGDFAAGLDLDIVLVRRVGQAVDDRIGGVGRGEDTPVSFRFEADSLLFEPCDGVSGVEAVEGAVQAAVTAGIVLDELAGVGAVMGDVATPSTGDADFGEDFFRFFENENAFDSLLGSGDGPKEPGRPSSDDNELIVVFGHELR